MFYKVVTLCAIVAVAQAKSTGKFANFAAPPENQARERFENFDTKPVTRFLTYSPTNDEYLHPVNRYDGHEYVRNYGESERAQVSDVKQYNDNSYNTHPKYRYSYTVNDDHTGDHKSHFEERDGDVVKGEYVVVDADGSIRTVTYTADAKNGFRATVKTRKGNSPSVQTEASLANQIPSGYTPYLKPTAPTLVYNQDPRGHQIQADYKPTGSYSKPTIHQNHRDVFVAANSRPDLQQTYKSLVAKPSINEGYDSYDRNRNLVSEAVLHHDYEANSYISKARPTTQLEYNEEYKPRHHNLVSELRYQDRLNHRSFVSDFSGEELDHGYGEDRGVYNGNYGFREKSHQKEVVGRDAFEDFDANGHHQ